jgi:hypothetical protein
LSFGLRDPVKAGFTGGLITLIAQVRSSRKTPALSSIEVPSDTSFWAA